MDFLDLRFNIFHDNIVRVNGGRLREARGHRHLLAFLSTTPASERLHRRHTCRPRMKAEKTLEPLIQGQEEANNRQPVISQYCSSARAAFVGGTINHPPEPSTPKRNGPGR